MQRRGESGQPVKGQRTTRPKHPKVPIASASATNLREQLDRRSRELDEALQQQTATSEVLSIIRRSPADAQPVFDAIVQSAARLCGAVFSVVYLCDGDHLRIAATKNFTPEATSQIYGRPELKRPDRSHTGGRAYAWWGSQGHEFPQHCGCADVAGWPPHWGDRRIETRGRLFPR